MFNVADDPLNLHSIALEIDPEELKSSSSSSIDKVKLIMDLMLTQTPDKH